MQANKNYFIMINNEAEYNQAVKMLQDMGFKLPADACDYHKSMDVVCTDGCLWIVRLLHWTKEEYKTTFPEDIELFLNNESKEMTTTKHNINIADHPELYDVIVLTRTQEEWNDVIQYDPAWNKIIPSSFKIHREESVIFCRKHRFTYDNLDWIKNAKDCLRVMYYSQWKALLENIVKEQKEDDKYLFANTGLKQFKDLSDNEKLIVVNALISDYNKVEYYISIDTGWIIKKSSDACMNSIYRVLK